MQAFVPPTPLIGRQKELWLARQQFRRADVRVLTLTGPPGVGKTRLAVALVEDVSGEFDDGVAFVDLSTVVEPSLVVREIARALGVGEMEGILARTRAHLANRSLLLLVDNFEHVLAAAPAIAEIAAACPRVKILATSRERLRIQWEHEFSVPPLEMPDRANIRDLRRLAQVPAVALFVERGQAVRPDFALSALNADAVAQICLSVDGLPLAIELAAARIKAFPPHDLAGRLAHRLDMLQGGARDMPIRHRALRAAIAWSHDLLPPEERVLFRRLGVFIGGGTTESIEMVCGEPGLSVAEGMAALIDKSLVQQLAQTDGPARFGMLESIRQYALDELGSQGEADAIRARHAECFAQVADRVEATIGTNREDLGLQWVGQERLNLRAAIDVSIACGEWSTAFRLAAGLGWYWFTRGLVGEGREVFDRLLDSSAAVPQTIRSAVVLIAGILAWSAGDLDRADSLLSAGASMSEEQGDVRRVAIASAFLGHVARSRGAFEHARIAHRKALALFEDSGSERGVAWAVHDLGLVARDAANEPEAGQHFASSLERFRTMGYPWAIAWNCWNLGRLALSDGDVQRAVSFLVEAAELFRDTLDRRGVSLCLNELASVCCRRGDYHAAARLLGAAAALRETLGAPLQGVERVGLEQTTIAVRSSLPERTFATAWQAGQAMSLPRGVEAAIAAVHPERFRQSPLTSREEEVASLIAEGSSNRAIAERLGIAERTVVSHVEHIMNKLSLNSRAEIAAWAVRSRVDQGVS